MAKYNSSVEQTKTTLELDEHLYLHEKGWKIQRFGWGFIFLFVALAAFGLFGEGLLSSKTLYAEGAKVDYDYFHRHEGQMKLIVDNEGSNGDSIQSIYFSQAYLFNFKVGAITPEPSETSIENGYVKYSFTGGGPVKTVFYLVPQHVGKVKGEMRINDHQFTISHFIYP